MRCPACAARDAGVAIGYLAISMRHALLALALVLACKSGGSPKTPKGADAKAGTDATTPAGKATDGPADARGKTGTTCKCAKTGKPWDGKPQDCPYEHQGCCYEVAEAACAAAGCEGPQCIVLESYPAQVRCDTQSDPATP